MAGRDQPLLGWGDGAEGVRVPIATSVQVWGTAFKAGDPKEHLWG